MIRGLEDAAKKLQIDYTPQKKPKQLPARRHSGQNRNIDSAAQRVPMMYRAQVNGRCSLQYGSNEKDLSRWTTEWVDPNANDSNRPRAQREEPTLGLDGSIYRMKVKFPWRVFTNSGEDSIYRPVMGKNGIPIIPGSSIKGLFERLSRSHSSPDTRREIRNYCGDADHQGWLRFHKAYPIGDWAGTNRVRVESRGQVSSETRYRMVDVVHPQQSRQVGDDTKRSPQAIAVISFFEPELVFELSCQPDHPLDEEGWKRVGGLLKRALRSGLGGKTSSGYGLCILPKDKYALNINLSGTGVSSLLRNNEPEFRPNLFKATLRGHATRLLSGVSDDKAVVKKAVDCLFGGTQKPGSVDLYWDMPSKPQFATQGRERTPIYRATGTLRLDAEEKSLAFCKQLVLFAYLMAGWGKSWRRVWHAGPGGWHPGFMDYSTRAIGCHWEWLDSEGVELPNISSPNDLQQFLLSLRRSSQKYLGVSEQASRALNWREAWHPNRLTVYANRTANSKAISLFHDSDFKTTPAIGGRKPDDRRPTYFSSVWHRMLPVEDEYLEIVTLFHSDRSVWKRDEEDQLQEFCSLLEEDFQKVYGVTGR